LAASKISLDDKSVLIVVDVQNCFLPGGSLAVTNGDQVWKGPKLDVVCSADTSSTLGFTISCQKFIAHIADAYIQSGEIAQRISEGGLDEMLTVIRIDLPESAAALAWLHQCDRESDGRAADGSAATSNVGVTHAWLCVGLEPQCWRPRKASAV
jgi:hypothetical protein